MNDPFIIAEMSANHNGSLRRALSLVDAAADAGADAIKIQTWTPGTMCINPDYVIEGGLWDGQRLDKLYEQAHTPWEWHEPIFERAAARGIMAFSSVFDTKALAFLQTIGCPMYKISSFELVDIPLIQAVAGTGRPMIMSTGMATFEEIASAWAQAGTSGCKDITLLKCTSAYPADHSHAQLAGIKVMKQSLAGTRTRIGVSDHTLGLAVPIAATALGAEVIEKHLTLSRDDGGPDAAFSLEPAEFAQMVTECRNAYKAIQGSAFGPRKGERTDLRRSVYVAMDIKAGDVITPEHLTTARPGEGMSPARMNRVYGRLAKVSLHRGQPFWEELAMDPQIN